MPPRAIRSILAATALDPGSDDVVRAAGALAARASADLHLLHAAEFGRPRDRAAPVSGGLAARVDAARAEVEAQAARVLPAGARPASVEVQIYAPHRAVLERAGDVGADLIVLGPHRRGDAHARFLGSTVDGVIRGARVPCLVVGAPLRVPAERIGAPVDVDDPVPGGLETALAWGPAFGAREVRAVHVGWEVERADDPALEARELVPALEAAAAAARRAAGDADAPPVAVEVRWAASPADGIVHWARESELDLLVMATHAPRGLRRMLLGSVAGSAARRASCPVLLVPPPRED